MMHLLSALVLGFCSTAGARDLAAIQKSGTLRVAVDGQTPGFNFYKGKELTGFEVELAVEMARRMGLKVQWTVQPFNTLLVGLGQDRFDLIATSHAITPERRKVADFSVPHYCTGAMIVSRPGGPKTLADLAGKTVAVPVGTVYFDYLKKQPKIKQVKTLPSETDGLQDLLGGSADAWVTEQFVAYQALQAHPKLQAGDVLFPQKNAMVIAKQNAALLDAWNTQLKAVLSDGTYARLSQKYFQRDIRCP